MRGWTTWLPRLYGIAVYLVAVVLAGPGASIRQDGRAAWFYAIGAALIRSAALFLGAAIAREPLWERAHAGLLHPERLAGRLIHRLERCPAPRSWHEVAHRYPLANLNILVTILLLLVLVFCAGWYPVEVGRLFGSAALGFLALGTWVSVLTALQLMQPRLLGFPGGPVGRRVDRRQLAPPLSPGPGGRGSIQDRPAALR